MLSKRVTLAEYGPDCPLADFVTASREGSASILRQADIRIRATLGIGQSALDLDATSVRARDFAGLIRLAPDLELEVAPKFVNPASADWRKDFLFLAELSKHGRILPVERLLTSGGESESIASLTAQAMVAMYVQNRRRPLRGYRQSHECGFEVEGDLDPGDVAFPPPEGFPQRVVRFDRQTAHNSEILTALNLLRQEVHNPRVLGPLERVIRDVSPQSRIPRRRVPVPMRSRAWGPVVELARDVIDGLGASFRCGEMRAPGYIVNTWRVWEDAVTLACRISMSSRWSVLAQKASELGQVFRWKAEGWQKHRKDCVRPDVRLQRDGRMVVVDAKYKLATDGAIADSDVYEALAFLEATKASDVILVFPTGDLVEPGDFVPFRRIQVGAKSITAARIQIGGIARAGGLHRFADGMRRCVEHLTAMRDLEMR